MAFSVVHLEIHGVMVVWFDRERKEEEGSEWHELRREG